MIEVEVWTGQPITTWRVPTHAVAAHVNDGRLALRLAEADELPNRDFVLRYRVADETPRATLLLGSPTYGDTGRYALIVQPPHLDVDTLVGRREMIYVIDRSGSMAGEPLALAKEVVREALARLRPVDTFDIVGFESGTERLFGAPRPANAANVALALRFIDGLQAGGGTNMENAVEAALQDDVAKGYVRYVLFVTDGYIAHESEIFAGAQRLVSRLARRGRRARVFAAGVGSAPNRHLVTGLARAGHGLALYVTNRERPRPAVQAFTRVVDTAVIEDLELMPGTLTLEDRHPAVLGDLLASQPLIAFGQYSGDLEESPVLVGRRGKEFVRIPVQVLPAETSGSMFDALWARAAVADLEPRLWVGHDPEAVAEITRLGLKHRIVTPFTSLIAVDRTRQIGDGFPRDIGMPTTAPEGIDPWMAGGDPYGQAEQRYTVQGANVNSPSFGTVGATRVQAVATSIRDSGGMASRPGRPERGFVAAPSTTTDFFAMDMGHGPTIARSKGLVPRLVIGRPRGSTDVPARSFLQAVRGVRTDLKHCWGAGRSPGARRRVQIVLTWSRDRTPRIEVMNHDAAPDHDACLIEVLESVEWPQPSPGTKVSIPLHFFTS